MKHKIFTLGWILSALALLAMLLGMAACTQPELELPFAQELQDAVDAGLEKYDGGKGGTPGVSVAVIVPGYSTWLGVSGVSHGTTPVTPDTPFAAGSIAKNFIAAIVLQLAEEGVLTLDDPLHKWLPDYANIDNTITIRQLLYNTGGIHNMTENSEYWQTVLGDPERTLTPEETIATFVLEPYFPKGTDWHYSNSGYLLLGMIINEATGSELSSESRNRLWTPLGLDSTFLPIEEALPENTAHGWFDLDGDGAYDEVSVLSMPSFYSSAAAAGGWFSTAEDLAKWSRALFHEGRVLSEQSLDQMLDFYSPIPEGRPDWRLLVGYGLGVVRFTPEVLNGLEIWGHSGDAPGYAAASLYLPDYGVFIGMATNTEEGERMAIINDLLSIITSHVEPTP